MHHGFCLIHLIDKNIVTLKKKVENLLSDRGHSSNRPALDYVTIY